MIELEKPLPEEEQIELFKMKDDPIVKEKLILHNLRLVNWVAKKFQKEGNPNRDLEDLFQEGVIGLIKAIEDYDSEKGAFSSYAIWHIRGSIQGAITNKGRTIRIPSYMVQLINELKKIRNGLELKLGREPTLKEISKKMDMDIDKVIEIMNIIENPISLYTIVGCDGEDITLLDIIPDDGLTPDEIAESKVFIEQFKKEFKYELEEFQYEIIRLHYGIDCPEHTLKEIAEKYDKTLNR